MKMPGMGSEQKFWALLSPDEQETLAALGLPKLYPPRATICLQDDPSTHVFILLAGWVKILSVTKDGHEIVLALRGGGDLVGETAGETTGRRNATIEAIGQVRALMVTHDKFSSFLDANPGANRAYRRAVTQKFDDTNTMLRRWAGTSGPQRLAALLLDLAEQHGRAANGAINLAMPLSQEELASMAGTSRATITRAYANWRKRGLIRTGQRHITIIDVLGLRRVAGQQW
jgi:CRP-like cAMP-binding protein